MGKLNIAHHKSYHPYRRDNIERVRKDEEEARRKEEDEDGRMMLADSEARIDLLREKSGVLLDKSEKKKKRRDDNDLKDLAANSSTREAVLPTTNGHINLFEDLEQGSVMAAIKATKKVTDETEKGVPLAPSAKDLKPWYSERTRDPAEGVEDEKRKRDESRKYVHDPLTSITKQLAARPSASTSSSSFKAPYRPAPPSKAYRDKPPEVQARLSRESTERERALELIRRKKREMEGNATPSTVFNDSPGGYGDVYNKREVEEAHRFRDRRWDHGHRHWDDDDRPKSRPSKMR